MLGGLGGELQRSRLGRRLRTALSMRTWPSRIYVAKDPEKVPINREQRCDSVKLVRTSELGLSTRPSAKILRLLIPPSELAHPSHNALSARLTRCSSPEYKSSGQKSSETSFPAVPLMFACMQNRQVRVLTGRVEGERWSGHGRKPHFG